MPDQIYHLAERAREQYRKFAELEYVLTPSIPILYFGDREAYLESNLRVVTVGHNPSDSEFDCEEDRFEGLETRGDYDTAEYLSVLNGYFQKGTDYDWFDTYEEVLKGLGVSYYGNHSENVALHTDLQSPLATTWQWSKLPEHITGAQEKLSMEGRELWYDLIETLRPDVILASIPIEDVRDICRRFGNGGQIGEGEEICRIRETKDGEERDSDYVVRGWDRKIKGSKTLIVYGKKIQKPFDSISHLQKREVGRAISAVVHESV